MGCDIHAAIEYRDTGAGPWKALLNRNKYFGKWEDESELTARLDVGRDYDLFAILGNVRNGRGFAGVKTGEGFDPMTDNRGIPEDISPEANEALSHEHSATWVTLPEILAYDWDRSSKHIGWVGAEEFEKWDRMKEWNPEPDGWCGGGNFKKITIEEMRQAIQDGKADSLGRTMCLIAWVTSYTHDARQMWTHILPKMLNLGRTHGFDNVRLVMDFDS